MQIDLGAGRRGVDMGPSALRLADLDRRLAEIGVDVDDSGDLSAVIPEAADSGDARLRYLGPIADACARLAERVKGSLSGGRLPLTLGGDHSLAIGSLAGSAAHHRGQGAELGLVWMDAHADFNTCHTTPSGNIHGMALAVCCGMGDPALTGLLGFAPKVHPERCVLIGARDLDPGERDNLRAAGVTVFTMREVDEQGMHRVVDRALEVAGRGAAGVHVSFDMDVLDPHEAPGTGTPVRGGISYREAHLAMEVIADSGLMRALDLVEINPVLDDRNKTASLGVELICSALGKKIL
ncbi:MAG: arginase [Candidatus Eisenbacteria bacterium]|nr:arginase [Candidatus Eisenbacteria bacterium]